MEWASPNGNLVEKAVLVLSKVGLAIYHAGEKLREKETEKRHLLVGGLQDLSETSSLDISAIAEIPGTPDGHQFLEHSGSSHLKGVQSQLFCRRPGLPQKTSQVPSAFISSSRMAPMQLSTSREWGSMKCPSLPSFDRTILQ